MRAALLILALATLAHGTTYYVCAAGGNSNTNATWCTGSSAGSAAGAQPSSAIDVVMDAGSGQLTINATFACQSFDANAFTGILTINNVAWNVGGSSPGPGNLAFRFGSGMTVTTNQAMTITFVSTSATQQTIDFGGKSPANLTFNGVGGSWKLTNGYTQATNNGFTGLTLTAGSLDTNGQTISTDGLVVTGTSARSLTLGASSINLNAVTGAGAILNFADTTNLTLSAGTSSIIVNRNSTSNIALATTSGSAVTLGTLTINIFGNFSSNIGQLNAAPGTTFDTLNLVGPSFATAGTIHISNNLVVSTALALNKNSATSLTIDSTDNVTPTQRCIAFAGTPSPNNSVLTNVVVQAVCAKVRHRASQGMGL